MLTAEKCSGKRTTPFNMASSQIKEEGDQQMTKRTAAKYKIDRRMGENIWGRLNHLLTEENMVQDNMGRDES